MRSLMKRLTKFNVRFLLILQKFHSESINRFHSKHYKLYAENITLRHRNILLDTIHRLVVEFFLIKWVRIFYLIC